MPFCADCTEAGKGVMENPRCIPCYFDKMKPGFRSRKHAKYQPRNTLTNHVRKEKRS